jgi:chromosome segregation ATPase
MQALQQLVYSDLPIPVWQIVLYVGFISYFMIQRWFKLSFVTSFVLVLYWLHYAFRADLVSITNEDQLARAIYYVLAFALILLIIFALSFLEVDADSLLAKREREITFLRAKAKNAEKTASVLQDQLEKGESQDSNAKKKLEKKFNVKIEKLEKRLQEAESLLETRDAEISDLQTNAVAAQKNASAFESLLEMYQTQESHTKKKLEEELTAKIEMLQHQLQEGEILVEKRNAEIAELRAEALDAETHAAAFKAQLEGDQAYNAVAANKKLEDDLTARIAELQHKLRQGESLLEQREMAISELQARASEAETNASTLKAQLESKLDNESASDKLEENLNYQINQLKNELMQGESLLEKRNAEVSEFKAKALEADKRASALKAQLDKDQTQGSFSKKKLEEKFNAKIAKLENQLKQSEALLEKRNTEISDLQAKASEAEKNASALQNQSENARTAVAAAHKKLEEELNARIGKLEKDSKERENLLEDRNSHFAELQARASEAEKNASTLKARLEKEQTDASAANKKLERELNAKIETFEEKLKQGETLLENRNTEITALRAKVSEAEKHASTLKSRLEKEQTQLAAANGKMAEELNDKITKLENQLKQGESLLEARNAEIAELKARASEAEKNASTLKVQLEKHQSQASAADSKLAEELNARIAKLEDQLKQGENALAKRNAEIAEFKAKAVELDKNASASKAQLETNRTQTSALNKKLGDELKAKVAKIEDQLKQSKSLLEERNTEISELKAKQAEWDKSPSESKPPMAINRQGTQVSDGKSMPEEDVRRKLHQFQYAVKYLEDEIKEKDRLLGLMAKKNVQSQASAKSAVDEDFKKKIHQLEQAVKYLENQGKEKDGLLGLMAKRNRELADLKSKAEERLEALEANIAADQTAKGMQPDIGSER